MITAVAAPPAIANLAPSRAPEVFVNIWRSPVANKTKRVLSIKLCWEL